MITSTEETLQSVIQYQFKNAELLTQSLTHKSFRLPSEKGVNNERLEFLGDAILGCILSLKLTQAFPEDDEGVLSKKRAALVNLETLQEVAVELQLGELLRLGKGESQTGGAKKPRLLASAVEALLGAIFLDGGYESVSQVVDRIFSPRVSSLDSTNTQPRDFKTQLQEKVQRYGALTPEYKLVSSEGPDHDKTFNVEVLVVGEIFGMGIGKSKKNAEQEAARQALQSEKLELNLEIKKNSDKRIEHEV